jgi:hypothetical protein
MTTSKTSKPDARTEYLTRDSILKLLSDDEIASVSTAETATRMAEGDEYLDLEHLDRGVRRADSGRIPMGDLLAKKAVAEATWTRILTQLVTPLA